MTEHDPVVPIIVVADRVRMWAQPRSGLLPNVAGGETVVLCVGVKDRHLRVTVLLGHSWITTVSQFGRGLCSQIALVVGLRLALAVLMPDLQERYQLRPPLTPGS
jgi:hypothetical protein